MQSPRHTGVGFTAPDFAVLEAQRLTYKQAGLAANTIASYGRDWRVFQTWCAATGRQALPATEETVELYVTDLLAHGRKVTTADRHARGIQYQHRIAGLESPCGPELRKLLHGARRERSELPRQKAALRSDDLSAMVAAIGTATAIGSRNFALLVFGFASALRRSSLARLQLADVTFHEEGLLVNLHHEKQSRKWRRSPACGAARPSADLSRAAGAQVARPARPR